MELAHFKNMPKLDSAIREMLRQQPTAMLVPRLAIKSFEAHTGNVGAATRARSTHGR